MILRNMSDSSQVNSNAPEAELIEKLAQNLELLGILGMVDDTLVRDFLAACGPAANAKQQLAVK
jgi:hypothetical protein